MWTSSPRPCPRTRSRVNVPVLVQYRYSASAMIVLNISKNMWQMSLLLILIFFYIVSLILITKWRICDADSLQNIILNIIIFGKLLFHFEVEARHTYFRSLITEEVIHVKNQTYKNKFSKCKATIYNLAAFSMWCCHRIINAWSNSPIPGHFAQYLDTTLNIASVGDIMLIFSIQKCQWNKNVCNSNVHYRKLKFLPSLSINYFYRVKILYFR